MNTITLNRKSNIMLMGRKFKIFIDGQKCDTISDGETKEIEIPEEAKELTIGVMLYKSKPIELELINAETYVIKQNIISTIASVVLSALALVFFISKYAAEQEQPIVLYMASPFVLISIFYSTFGRKNVLQIEKVRNNPELIDK